MISHGVTELKTSPHSVLAQKMCFSLPPTFFLESLPITEFTFSTVMGGRGWSGYSISKGVLVEEPAPAAAAPNTAPPRASLDPNQRLGWPRRSSSTCDREVQHGQDQPLPTTTVLCCNAMQPWLPHRSWTAHRAPAWHRPPQRGEAPQRGRKSSHRTWLGSGAAPWNPPHLPQASPSPEPGCG